MKTKLNLAVLLLISLSLLQKISGQNNPYFIAGGNPFFGIDGVNFGNNFLGTTTPVPIRFGTNGFDRMFIADGGGGPGTGFVGIGNSFFSLANPPRSRLHLHQIGANFIYTQWTNSSTGAATNNDGLRIGITNTGIAEIRQQEDLNLIFYTGLTTTSRMCIVGLTTNQGFVGIGTNFLTPNQLLTLNAGNINIQNITTGIDNAVIPVFNPLGVMAARINQLENAPTVFSGPHSYFGTIQPIMMLTSPSSGSIISRIH